MPSGKPSVVNVRKNSQPVINYFQKNYEDDITVQQGVKLVATPFFDNLDNPRQNMEIVVITESGTKFLNEEEIDRVVSSIEKEKRESGNQMDEEK